MSILTNVRAYLHGRGILRVDIEYENGTITAIREADLSAPSSLPGDAIVLPGLIDQHIHALCGADTMDATAAAAETVTVKSARRMQAMHP